MLNKEKKIAYSKTHNNFRYTIHNTNSNNNNSIHINLCAWIEPMVVINPLKFFNEISTRIKREVSKNTTKNGFRPKAIVDTDIRYSNVKLGKKSFASIDITVFNHSDNTTDMNRRCVRLADSVTEMVNNQYVGVLNIAPTKKLPATV